jgi:hypothetical protein
VLEVLPGLIALAVGTAADRDRAQRAVPEE